ncbi:hypothetical protein T11_2320, partial [Trichinella zimbabwensis]
LKSQNYAFLTMIAEKSFYYKCNYLRLSSIQTITSIQHFCFFDAFRCRCCRSNPHIGCVHTA